MSALVLVRAGRKAPVAARLDSAIKRAHAVNAAKGAATRAQILDLAEDGRSRSAIARELGLSYGHVKHVLLRVVAGRVAPPERQTLVGCGSRQL